MDQIYSDYCSNQLNEQLSILKDFEHDLQLVLCPQSNDAVLNEFIKLKYQDIHSDYLLLNLINQNKIIELINKKLTLVNSAPDNMKIELIEKIIELLVILKYDFRKAEILKFIHKLKQSFNIHFQDELFLKLLNKDFIHINEFESFLAAVKTKWILKLPKSKLIENLIQTNLSVLPLSYKSIKLQNINRLFGVEVDESIISKMISDDNLNGKINQLNQCLVFDDFQLENNIFDIIEELSVY